MFAGLLVGTLICICLWQRFEGGLPWHCRISTVLAHDRLHCGRQLVHRVWFLVSDVGWLIYPQVAVGITTHQVFSSGKLSYAYLLLAILLVPFAFMFILVARISIKRCQENIGGGTLMRQAAAPVIGLLLAPVLLLGIELELILHSIGVALPRWWGSLGVDLVTLYRMQSVAEAFLNALPQAVGQSKLYLMGPNDPLIYIDTNLFVLSMTASLLSVFTTVALIVIELFQYNCSMLEYCIRLVKFETFHRLPAVQWDPIYRCTVYCQPHQDCFVTAQGNKG